MKPPESDCPTPAPPESPAERGETEAQTSGGGPDMTQTREQAPVTEPSAERALAAAPEHPPDEPGKTADGRQRGKRLAGRSRGKKDFGAPKPDERTAADGQNENAKPLKPGKPKKRKASLKRALTRFLIKLALIGLTVWLLVTQVGGVFICHTDDMYPALRDGDLVITYRLGEYHSGDVVAYRQGGQTLFGRIVGEPGDEIIIDENGTFTVNGLRPYEVIFYTTMARESDQTTYPYTVRPGEYFILADSREQAADSRTFGPATELLGKVVLQLRRRGF